VADVAGDTVPLHRVEDVPGAVHEGQPCGFAVQAGAERAHHGVGTLDGAVDGVGVGQLADDHVDAVAPSGRDLLGVASVGGHGVPVGEKFVDGEGSDGAGGAEDGDVHAGWCFCSRGEDVADGGKDDVARIVG
jgi:hypothetical protein